MDDQQERQLAQGLREGRIDAWHALYEAHVRPVWQYVARRMGPAAGEVADVVQETFLAAAQSARTYDPTRGPLRGWIVGIAKKQVALCYRKLKRQDRIKAAGEWLATTGRAVLRWLERREETPPEALASAELATLVRAALSELSADYEALLSARYLDGVPVEELATKENSTETAIRSKLARARRAFREVFSSHQPSAISFQLSEGRKRKAER
jgi:RNA polymerase sigma-70 factor (ECF subfamily)